MKRSLVKKSVCEEKGGGRRISLYCSCVVDRQSWRAERAVGECCFVAFFFGDCSRQAAVKACERKGEAKEPCVECDITQYFSLRTDFREPDGEKLLLLIN